MLEELLPLIRGKADIEYRDIDTQPAWCEKFDIRVPVVEYEGAVISEYPLDYGAIRAVLERIAQNSK
jgi:hypothetical protein